MSHARQGSAAEQTPGGKTTPPAGGAPRAPSGATVAGRLQGMIERLAQLRRQEGAAREKLESEVAEQKQRCSLAGEQLREVRSLLAQTKAALDGVNGAREDSAAVLWSMERRLLELTRPPVFARREGAEEEAPAFGEIVDLRREREDLARRLAQAESDLSATRERLAVDAASMAEERSSLQNQVRGLKRYLSERSDECARLLGELRRAKEKTAQAGPQSQARGSAAPESSGEIGKWQARVRDLEMSLKVSRERDGLRIARLERDLGVSNERMTHLERALQQARELLERERATVARGQTDSVSQAEAKRKLKSELASSHAKVEDLENKLEYETQQLLMQLSQSSDRIERLEKERVRFQEEIGNLMSAKERLERDLKQLRRQAELEQQKMEMVRLHARLEEVAWAHPEARKSAASRLDAADARRKAPPAPPAHAAAAALPADFPIVAVGASTGGPAALGEILPMLPAHFPACVLIVQHMPPGYTAELAAHLDQRSKISVVEARHGDPLQAATAYIAPGGHHMEVRGGVIRLSAGPPVNKQRPSVDVLFDSLISVARSVRAVLLTGMGYDGVAAMGRLRAAGSDTVVQDEATSVVWGMPGAAVSAGCAGQQLPPVEIGNYLCREIVAREDAGAPVVEQGPAASTADVDGDPNR